MRSSEEMKKIILEVAATDDRVRAVLLNGSRTNDKVEPDLLQDFDVVYIVNHINSFTSDHRWTNVFGRKIMQQLPDEMTFGNESRGTFLFHYLMLFEDGNRIDLTLFPAGMLTTHFIWDSLTVVWLDKDNLFPNTKLPDDSDYWIRKPVEKEFLDTCNEFWWVCTYVSKGLLRNEIVYAKEMFENPVRKMFMKMIDWSIGANTGFSVSTGKSGKFIKRYLTDDEYNTVLNTYSDSNYANVWNSLFAMTGLFSRMAKHVADTLNFIYNLRDETNTLQYLKQQYNSIDL